MQDFKLPDLGEGMHEAEVVEWLVKAGDTVKLDQTMVKVETDKAIVEIPSPVAGRIGEIRVQDGQVAKVGEVLVVFETSASSTGSSTRGDASSKTAVASSALKPSAPEVSVSPKKRVLAAPAVRKLAFELGVNLDEVIPSHPSGRVTLEDVQNYANHSKTAALLPEAAPVEAGQSATPVTPTTPATPTTLEDRQPLTGLRKRIAEHIEHAWRTIPHATDFAELDRLFEGARKRVLLPRELSGSTFTLNNVGSFGRCSVTPIINHPEVAILAVGRLQEKAVVQQGEIVARPMMPLALSFDHRLIDGAIAGAFLGRFKALVENPQQLMLDMT